MVKRVRALLPAYERGWRTRVETRKHEQSDTKAGGGGATSGANLRFVKVKVKL